MSVRSAQSITVEFITSNPSTQAALNADSTPVGTLVVNGTDNGASVTVTNVDTGRYKAAVTLPTLAIGDVVELSVAATVSTIAGKAIVWRDTKDVLLDGSGDVTFSNTSIGTVTTLTNLPAITTDWLTGTGVAASAVTKIQAGLATPTNITAGTITTVTTLTNLPAITTDWLTGTGVAASAVTKIQAGLSTYAGGAVASVTGDVGGNVTGTIGGFTAAALAEFFTLDTTKAYVDAIAGSVIKEIPTGGGGGTVDANIVQILGQTALAAQQGLLDVRLAEVDGTSTPVAHGGTPGSSLATVAAKSLSLVSPEGSAAFDVRNVGTGIAMQVVSATSSGSPAIYISGSGGADGTIAIVSLDGHGIAISGSLSGIRASGGTQPGLDILSGGSHGIRSTAGTAQKALLLVGDAVTDSFAVAAGAGSPFDVFDAAARVLGRFDATGLANLFTIDSTKVYADAVTGSPVKEIGSQAGGGGTVDAHVVSYATGEDPATLLLASPANKLATDSSGRVTGSATLLDATPVTDPGGVASTFPQMLVQVWRRYFKRAVKETTGHTIKTYADDNTTVRTTQSYTDDGAGNQTQGPAT